MTILFAGLLIIAGLVTLFQTVRLFSAWSERDDYQSRWELAINSPNRTNDAMVYEWENRDLVRKWELCYPHVQEMQPMRKYSEWLTFCANYPSREAMETQLGKVTV
jgi:hypothetical protein